MLAFCYLYNVLVYCVSNAAVLALKYTSKDACLMVTQCRNM
jgi:hypothetical protein